MAPNRETMSAGQDQAAGQTPPADGLQPAGPAGPAEPGAKDQLGEWVAGSHDPGAPVMDPDPAGRPGAVAGGAVAATGTGDSLPDRAGALTGKVPDERSGLGQAGVALMTDEPALRESWLKIQSGFVDDPRGAVSEAAGFLSDVTGTLVTALRDRETALRRSWEGGGTDTEDLRNAIREYRSFFEALLRL